jgi:hypothetical protein
MAIWATWTIASSLVMCGAAPDSQPADAASARTPAEACLKLEARHLPGLLFRNGDKLELAWFEDGAAHVEPVLATTCQNVYPMAPRVLLVTDRKDAWLVDLARGRVLYVMPTRGLRYIGTSGDAKRAMLLRVHDVRNADALTRRADLIELDLATGDSRVLRELTTAEFGPDFGPPRMAVSPDFRRLAYAVARRAEAGKAVELGMFDLVMLNLEDASSKPQALTSGVRLLLSPLSSFAGPQYTPPCVWPNNEEVLFLHIDLIEPEPRVASAVLMPEVAHVLKVVNVATREVRDVARKKSHLSLDGGTLRRDPLTKDTIIYDAGHMPRPGEWTVVDPGARVVDSAGELLASSKAPTREATLVIEDQSRLANGLTASGADAGWPPVSDLTKVTADCSAVDRGLIARVYRIRPPNRAAAERRARAMSFHHELYVKLPDRPAPVKVLAVDGRIEPVAWLTD